MNVSEGNRGRRCVVIYPHQRVSSSSLLPTLVWNPPLFFHPPICLSRSLKREDFSPSLLFLSLPYDCPISDWNISSLVWGWAKTLPPPLSTIISPPLTAPPEYIFSHHCRIICVFPQRHFGAAKTGSYAYAIPPHHHQGWVWIQGEQYISGKCSYSSGHRIAILEGVFLYERAPAWVRHGCIAEADIAQRHQNSGYEKGIPYHPVGSARISLPPIYTASLDSGRRRERERVNGACEWKRIFWGNRGRVNKAVFCHATQWHLPF